MDPDTIAQLFARLEDFTSLVYAGGVVISLLLGVIVALLVLSRR